MLNIGPFVLLSIKLILLVLLGMYSVFSFVVLGKVRYLSQILKTDVSPVILLAVMANFLLSLGLLLVSLIVL